MSGRGARHGFWTVPPGPSPKPTATIHISRTPETTWCGETIEPDTLVVGEGHADQATCPACLTDWGLRHRGGGDGS